MELGSLQAWGAALLFMVSAIGIVGIVGQVKSTLGLESASSKKAAAIIVSVIAGVLTMLAEGTLNLGILESGQLPVVVVALWGLSVAIYENAFHNSE